MNTFTAAEVREHAQIMRDEADDVLDAGRIAQLEREYRQVSAMLDAFAQRLEAEDKSQSDIDAYALRMAAAVIAKGIDGTALALYKAGCEQGRREVLAEIAKQLPPPITLGWPFSVEPIQINRMHYCLWCDQSGSRATKQYDPVNHAPTCLWLRAQQVTP